MRTIDKFILRLRSLFRRKKVEAELEDELRFHLDQLVNEMVSAGVAPDEARQSALRSMGSIAQSQEECRDMRGTNVWEDFLRDMGYAWRSFTRTPVFFLSVILILAVGIGVNSAVFTVVRSVVLNPLPYPNAHQLVVLWKASRTDASQRSGVAPGDFLDIQQQVRNCAPVAAFTNTYFDVTGFEEPYRVIAARISSNFFATLGVHPAVGRDFTPDDDQPSAARVAILSHALWHSRFNGRPDIVGLSITLNNEQYAIAGVMPRDFVFPEIDSGWAPEVWTSLRFTHERTERGSGYMRIIARLKPGISPEAARAEFDSFSRQFVESQPRAYGGKVLSMIPLQENVVGDVRQLLLVLLGAVICVLLITCTNLANMLLVRSTARVKELAVRSSLGASHLRLARQLLTENLALGLCGGALGLGLAFALIRALPLIELTDLPRAHEISVDGWIVAFSFGLAALTGLFFGVLPVYRISRVDPHRSMQASGRVVSSRGANAFRALFGVVQVSLALMLVTGAALLLRSFVSLQKTNLGFQPANVLTFQLPLPKDMRDSQRRTAYYREVEERISRLPQAQSVGMISYLPLAGNVFSWGIFIQGRDTPAGAPSPSAEYRIVSGNLFSALTIAIKAGRGFDERDRADTFPAGIINETMARRYWPGEDPIGKKFRLGGPASMFPWVTVIGVAADVRYGGVEAAPEPTIYQTLAQTPGTSLSVVVRSKGNPMDLVGSIRSEIRQVDRSVPLLNVRQFDYFVSKSLARRRLVLTVLSTFGLIALFLAAFGMYSVISHSVTQRTQEIGLRVALGARVVGVLKLVLKQAIWISLVGIAAGLAGILALGRVVRSLLYEVSPTDPLTIAAVSILLLLVTVVASYFPARRALRVDPLVALRHE